MAIRIISDDERLTKIIDGTTFFYRRIPAHIRNKIINQCTNKRSGNVNFGEASLRMLKYALSGWENAVDGNGTQVDFDPTLITYIPDSAQAELVDDCGGNAELELEKERKNLKPSPSSST